MARLTLLGPQRRNPCVARVLADLGASGKVAVISAGWEEREGEVDELREHVQAGAPACELVDLPLFERAERLFAADRALLAALRRRSERRQRLLELYRLRLDHAADTLYALLDDADPQREELAREEAGDALRGVMHLDERNLRHMRDLQALVDEQLRGGAHPAWDEARAEIHAALDPCGTVMLAGGHVGVLLDRLRLFGLEDALRARDVVAWSAGAMAATERVLLFHDSPPQGRGHAEMYAPGLGLAPGVVALPHAGKRLLLDDAQRVSVLASRLAPATCVCLDEGGRADWDGKAWDIAPGTRWMTTEGTLAQHAVDGAGA